MSKEPFWILNVVGGAWALLILLHPVSSYLNDHASRSKNNGSFGLWLRPRLLRRGLIFFLPVFFVLSPPSFAADATNITEPSPAKLETNAAPDPMRVYLELQEQLHTTQLAIEHNRQEAQTATAHSAEVIAARLKALEDSLAAQRASLVAQRDDDLKAIDAIQDANRLMFKIGSACAAVGFLALLLTAYFQWRAVNRLTEFSVVAQAALSPGRGVLPSPGATDTNSVSAATEQANTRLLDALERLEKRIVKLEHTARPPLGEPNFTVAGAAAGKMDRVTLLLAKGESLLSLKKTAEALACYDEILALEPDHSEALVKKGDALDGLHKIDDAIGCYDRAIAADGSLTVAYLHKGGLFNRLERYEEALQCFEQALRTQEKSDAA